MSTFKETFPGKHTFLAVVHVEEGIQALRNAEIAEREGADGIFLINHSIPYSSLIECYCAVRMKYPQLWIGLNCLDLGMSAVSVVPKKTAGLWIDNAGITESDFPAVGAQKFARIRKESGWDGIYFGGVAFKYQEEVIDVAKVARLAVPGADAWSPDIALSNAPNVVGLEPVGRVRPTRLSPRRTLAPPNEVFNAAREVSGPISAGATLSNEATICRNSSV